MTHRDWDKMLPEVAFAMRTAESVVTGYTPAFLCYGRELRTPWDHRQQLTCEEVPSSAPHRLAVELDMYLQDALHVAREYQCAARENQARQYNRRRQPTTFKVGDLVLRDTHPLSKASTGFTAKLAPRRTGPFRITAQVGRNTYSLQHPDTRRKQGLANADQLTPYYPAWTPSCTD